MKIENFRAHMICDPKELWASLPGAPLTYEQKLEIYAFNSNHPVEYYKDKDMSNFF